MTDTQTLLAEHRTPINAEGAPLAERVFDIIGEAIVSFLGYGVDPTVPTWGNILSNSLTFLLVGNWWWPLFPGLAIILTVLAVNFIGDGLRDALDPRSRL